jgi:hypothetical protein
MEEGKDKDMGCTSILDKRLLEGKRQRHGMNHYP